MAKIRNREPEGMKLGFQEVSLSMGRRKDRGGGKILPSSFCQKGSMKVYWNKGINNN